MTLAKKRFGKYSRSYGNLKCGYVEGKGFSDVRSAFACWHATRVRPRRPSLPNAERGAILCVSTAFPFAEFRAYAQACADGRAAAERESERLENQRAERRKEGGARFPKDLTWQCSFRSAKKVAPMAVPFFRPVTNKLAMPIHGASMHHGAEGYCAHKCLRSERCAFFAAAAASVCVSSPHESRLSRSRRLRRSRACRRRLLRLRSDRALLHSPLSRSPFPSLYPWDGRRRRRHASFARRRRLLLFSGGARNSLSSKRAAHAGGGRISSRPARRSRMATPAQSAVLLSSESRRHACPL